MARKRQPPASPLALMQGAASGTMRAHMGAYLESMQVKGYTEQSVESRGPVLHYFALWCEERGITRAQEVTRPILQRYQRWLFYYRKKNGQPLGMKTQHTRINDVALFFRWLTRQNHLFYNPASELELPRKEKRLPKAILSVGEMEKVLAKPDLADPLGVRDRAIMEVLYSTGMRRKELVGLTVFDLDHARQTVMIRLGKGKKDRLIPIGERALLWLEKYVTEVRPKLVVEPDEGVVFLSGEGEPLDRRYLSHLVSSYVDAANIGKEGSCHLFRHTMATLMLEAGADTRFIQQMLGHESLESTQIYTQVSIRKLHDTYRATHPAAKLARRAEQGREDEGGEVEVDRAEILAQLDAEAEEDGEGA